MTCSRLIPTALAVVLLIPVGCAIDMEARNARDAALAREVRAEDAPRYYYLSKRGILQRMPPPNTAGLTEAQANAALALQVRQAETRERNERDRRFKRGGGGFSGSGG
ncbi:MAG: hypothetical protein AAF710_11770 [Planctomycetota bacterium]